MKNSFWAYLLVGLICFCSCSKSEDNGQPAEYTPQYVSYYGTPVLEIPYTTFGVTKEQVKQSLRNRTIKEETAEKLVYEGDGDCVFQVYYFESDKLIESATHIKSTSKDAMIKDALALTYGLWGETPFDVYADRAFYIGMVKQRNDNWLVVFVPHDRVTYKENTGNGVITIDLPKIIKSREYLI